MRKAPGFWIVPWGRHGQRRKIRISSAVTAPFLLSHTLLRLNKLLVWFLRPNLLHTNFRTNKRLLFQLPLISQRCCQWKLALRIFFSLNEKGGASFWVRMKLGKAESIASDAAAEQIPCDQKADQQDACLIGMLARDGIWNSLLNTSKQ